MDDAVVDTTHSLRYYTIVVDSRDRISAVEDPTNFRVKLQPQMTRVHALQLQYAFLPFVFSNVTTTYGNLLSISINNSSVSNVTVPIYLPTGFYSLTQLVQIMNTELAAQFNSLFTTPPYPSGSNICPITFSLSEVTNRIYMTYNATAPWNASGSNPVTVTFNLLPKTASGLSPNYLLTMIGLPNNVSTVFTIPTGTISNVFTLPNPATAQLPINGVIINIVGLPSKVLTTSQRAGQFYIGVTAANLSGQHVNLPNTFKVNNNFFNSIFLEDNYFAFAELNIYLTDNNGYPLYPDQNPTDWNMSMVVTTYK